MKTKVSLIDADGHIVERDADIYRYLEEPFKANEDLLNVAFFPSLDGWNRAARRAADRKGRRMPAPQAAEWLGFLEDSGVERSVIYPTNALGYGLVKDREWAIALARAYNAHVHNDFVKADASRLSAVALIPLQDVEAAVAELRRAVTDLGMVGGMLPAVGLRRPLGDPYYDPVYREAERLGCMLAVHGAPAQGLGFDFFERLVEARVLSHPFAQMIQMTSMVMGGVLERFPKLRVSFMEAGAGWLPFMAERLDRESRNRGAGLKIPPSEQLRSERMFYHCELDEDMLSVAIEKLGDGHFFSASDFPHEPASEYLENAAAFMKRSDIPEAAKPKILADNARRLYNF